MDIIGIDITIGAVAQGADRIARRVFEKSSFRQGTSSVEVGKEPAVIEEVLGQLEIEVVFEGDQVLIAAGFKKGLGQVLA